MRIVTPSAENIHRAAVALHEGKLIGMPTETVYGLAGSAVSPSAVRRIYAAKGRPAENPLIVHIASSEDLGLVAAAWPVEAEILAARFWPGPLTLVLHKRPTIPDAVTGGLNTVAVRVPRHPVAIELIRIADLPVAAPSANLFMRVSPTAPEDIDPELMDQVEFILDGGDCEMGLESTVLDMTVSPPRILRPGAVSRADIQAALGRPLGQMPTKGRRSPGMYTRHYAPSVPLLLVPVLELHAAGLTFETPANDRQIKMPNQPMAFAANLYRALHRLERLGVDQIQVQQPPSTPEWEAISDRLTKASSN